MKIVLIVDLTNNGEVEDVYVGTEKRTSIFRKAVKDFINALAEEHYEWEKEQRTEQSFDDLQERATRE